MRPSTESVSTKTPRHSEPMTRKPSGMRVRAAMVVATVPITVTLFGVNPIFKKTRATGVNSLSWIPRALLPRTILLPFAGKVGACVGEQLGQRFRLPDDGQKVRIPGPPGHHVLMGVGRNARAGAHALIHSKIEASGAFGGPQDVHTRGDEISRLMPLLMGQIRELGNVPIRAYQQMAGVV